MSPSSAAPIVNRFIRRIAWCALRERGFERATARSAWRNRIDGIEVINFRSAVNSGGQALFLGTDGNGNFVDASLGSFAVNAGIYYTVYRYLPWRVSVYTELGDPERPEEWMCHERLRVATSRAQGQQYPADIWEVRSMDPSDAEHAVVDALRAIETQALPWFEENSNLVRAYSRLKPGCWVCAEDLRRHPDEYFRHEDLFAALAIRTGHAEEALRLFETIAARPVSVEERAAYDKAARQQQRRIARAQSKQLVASAKPKPILTEIVPFWHDGANARVLALRTLLQNSVAR